MLSHTSAEFEGREHVQLVTPEGENSSLKTASYFLWATSKLQKQQAPKLPVYLGH